LAALVFGLALASASPDLHAWLHGETAAHGHEACRHTEHAPAKDDSHEHRCAVVLFANGADLPFAAVVVLLRDPASSPVALAPEALHLAPPRYLRQPERGPPLA
jgi:hypothetical protein